MAHRQASRKGTTVRQELSRLWNLGQGLPMDAIKKNGLAQWTCPRAVEREEVSVRRFHLFPLPPGRRLPLRHRFPFARVCPRTSLLPPSTLLLC